MFTKRVCLILLCLATNSVHAKESVLDLHTWQTKNGVPVYFVPAHQIPIVDVQLAFAAGAARDNGKAGLATLTSSLLNQGSTNASDNQIAERLADVGAQFNADAARDMAVVGLRTLRAPQFLKPAVSTFTDILTKPAFNEDAFKRERNSLLSSIAQNNQQPDNIADQLLYTKIYDKHPYASPPEGTQNSVTQLTQSDVKNFYQEFYVAHNAVMSIVGDLSMAEARELSEQITRGLKDGKKAPALPEPKALGALIEYQQNFPAQQTNIRMGQAFIAHNNPNYFPLVVGNYTLGGGMLVSRLVTEIREKRGLSYSVSSQFIPMESKGPFLISLGTKNENAKEALHLTKQVLSSFVKEGPTTKELEAAKQFLTGSFPLRFDSNKDISAAILAIGFYNMPMNFYDTYRARIQSVTLTDIQSAYASLLHPEKMAVISVGPQSLF